MSYPIIQLLPGISINVTNRHSTYGRVKVKNIQLFLGKYIILHRVFFAFLSVNLSKGYVIG